MICSGIPLRFFHLFTTSRHVTREHRFAWSNHHNHQKFRSNGRAMYKQIDPSKRAVPPKRSYHACCQENVAGENKTAFLARRQPPGNKSGRNVCTADNTLSTKAICNTKRIKKKATPNQKHFLLHAIVVSIPEVANPLMYKLGDYHHRARKRLA